MISMVACGLAVLIFTSVLRSQSPPPRAEITKLEIGKPIQRPLSGGHAESFRLELSANQYAKIDVQQLGIGACK